MASRGGGAAAAPRPKAAQESAERRDAVTTAPTADLAQSRLALPASLPLATLRGRCVDVEERPLAGVTISMLKERGGDENHLAEEELRHGPREWVLPAPQTSGDDGRFEFRFVPPLGRRTPITARMPGRVTAGHWPKELAPGEAWDAGDLTMPKGCLLRGSVRDLTGAPVAKLWFSIRMPDAPRSDDDWRLGATTRDDGSYELQSPAPPGRYRIESDQPFEPSTFELGAGLEQVLDLRLLRPGIVEAIDGQVVDAENKPVEWALVKLTAGKLEKAKRTDAEGRFAFFRREDEPADPVRLATRLEYDEIALPEPVAWGTRDVRLVADAGGALDLLVVDGTTGAPIGRYGVRLVPTGSKGVGYSASRRLQHVGEHVAGRLRIRNLLPDTHMLSVETSDPRFVPTAYAPVRVDKGPAAAVRVECWPACAVACRVFDGRGNAKAGSRIELVLVTGGPDPERGVPAEIRARTEPYFGRKGSRCGTVLAETVTDASGAALLRAPRGGPFAVRVRGDHRELWREEVRFPSEGRMTSGAATRSILRPRTRGRAPRSRVPEPRENACIPEG